MPLSSHYNELPYCLLEMHFYTLMTYFFVGLIDDFDMAMDSENSSEHLHDPECPTNNSSSDESDFDMVSVHL